MKRKVVLSNAYGSGLSTAQGHMSEIHRYDLAESRTFITAAEEGWDWRRLISALLTEGWDRGDIFNLNSYGWFPDGRPIVVEVEGPYQIHDYDGKEYIVSQAEGYWRH
jgi:hypothetical protein